MPSARERLATALAILKTLQDKGLRAIPGTELARADREALRRAGFLREVMRGWYVPSRPDEAPGDTTAWYAGMRDFVAGYANKRFGDRWHVNPEQSLLLASGERTLPTQLQLWATEGTNQTVKLLHGCSLFVYRAPALLPASPVANCGGLRLADLPAALVAASPTFFSQQPMAAQIVLASVPDAADLLRVLLAGSHSIVAGRLAGAFRAIGRAALAEEILGAMHGAGYAVAEANPFERPRPSALPGGRPASPFVQRLRLLWAEMREPVIAAFPPPPGVPGDLEALLREIDARYAADAYHSLSIEGYRVSATLIENVRDGRWNPDANERDRTMRDALAARGYFEAHVAVKEDMARIVGGENPGAVFAKGMSRWYRALFAPSVQAGILQPADLAGYRNDQVFIRGTRHVPPPKEAVRDCMPTLFELLESEPAPQVRAVLGHFLFVYIHPYMDGNGRLARLLMNLMLASAGYAWTIIPVDQRGEYMHALERASSFGDIVPFAALVAGLERTQARWPLSGPP